MSETRPSAERMTQEQLAATRQFVHDHPGACLDGAMMLAELDAVTRENVRLAELVNTTAHQRDEALKGITDLAEMHKMMTRERDLAETANTRLHIVAEGLGRGIDDARSIIAELTRERDELREQLKRATSGGEGRVWHQTASNE